MAPSWRDVSSQLFSSSGVTIDSLLLFSLLEKNAKIKNQKTKIPKYQKKTKKKKTKSPGQNPNGVG